MLGYLAMLALLALLALLCFAVYSKSRRLSIADESCSSLLPAPSYSETGESAPCPSLCTKLPRTATRRATVFRNTRVPKPSVDPGVIIRLDEYLSASVAYAGCPTQGSGVSAQPPRRAISDGALGTRYDTEESRSGQALEKRLAAQRQP